MKSLLLRSSLALLALLPAFAAADEGMWLFDNPPLELLESRYGFKPTPEWLEHVQKSATRFSTGGSGSIVSRDGLVMTNHHVGADILEKLSSPERNLLETGFYARERSEELACPDLELHVLWSIEDVTERVMAAGASAAGTAEAGAARRSMSSEIESESEQETGLFSQVVTLYRGGRYHLYRYKRYTDVRLVMAPEQQAAFFGGDTDNFEFPRYALDMCFFRIYEDGQPLRAEHWLDWSPDGCAEGELVFVAGHPGRTSRLNTVAHNRVLRDLQYPDILNRLWRMEVQLTNFSERSAENKRIATGDLFGVKNSRKAYTGMLAALHEPELFRTKARAENALRAAVDENPEWKAQWGDAWDQIEQSCRVQREMYARYVALGGSRLNLRSELFGIAVHLVRMAEELPKPSGERLREYAESGLPSLERGLFSPHSLYIDLEIERLASSLSFMAERLGAEDPTVLMALAGKSPRARAVELVGATSLADVEVRKHLAEGGAGAIAESADPIIRLARALDPEARAWRKRWEDEVASVQQEAYAKIAAAQFAHLGESVYPDATFTLRLAFGTVKGYEENGRRVEPFTTMGGTFERAAARAGEAGFELVDSWTAAREAIAADTPYNFVSTPDIIGGNSGSPVINTDAEVVGLIFDGNIQSLGADLAYSSAQARATSVDSRGMIEAMRKIYGADELADELTARDPGN